MQDQPREFPFANDFHQPSRLQFFDVMGERCGADSMDLVQLGAGCRTLARSDLLQNPYTSWLGQNPRNARKLTIRQSSIC